jgi:type IV secretion system protein VirB4
MRLNPFSTLRDGEIGKIQAREFLLRRIAEAGDKVTAEDRQEIYRVLDNVAQSSQDLCLSTIWTLMPRHLQTLLSEWVKGGPFGYFDSVDDDFSLSSWTCIEMREIMGVERLSRAFLDHMLTSITRNLTGKPTLIYLEEASFLLNNPAFLDAIDGWLKTFRKLNAMVWMTVQSPESVSGVDSERIRATLADNVPNLVLGYNPRLENHRDLYRTMFGMTHEQINMIGELTPKRDYLRVFNGQCKTMRTHFDEHTLAYLRSEPVYQDLFDQAQAMGGEDWREWYIQQALKRKKL